MSEPKGETVEKRVLEILNDYFQEEDIDLETDFVRDLSIDSLDSIELVESLEKEFDMVIPDSDVQRLVSPKDITGYVEKRLQEKTSVKGHRG